MSLISTEHYLFLEVLLVYGFEPFLCCWLFGKESTFCAVIEEQRKLNNRENIIVHALCVNTHSM